ncbi:Syd protein [Streptomyces sp. NBRC 110611]|uniref:hypothetical protein n=1 Tax=Streptomyces sp. NBRC 110611 TaxID=1621259 RepID=UPI00083476B8|nr:hypothetical protein [Streptomyces sp. NBRC 110611]GAU67703.1 Syd protein [Streptomyces sp. NBRC 110611]
MSGYQERPVELPLPYREKDLDPAPVPGCKTCAAEAEERYQARAKKEFGLAAISSMKIAEHVRFGSHNDTPETPG